MWPFCPLLLSLLLRAAPFCSCSTAYCCCCSDVAIAVAAAVGQHAGPYCCGLHQLQAAPSCSAVLQLLLLQNLGRTIVCSTVPPSPGLKLATTPLALANQQLSLLGCSTCLTRPGQDSVAASLSIVRTIIRSLDQDLQQTGRIHPDCPCPPIVVVTLTVQPKLYCFR